MCRQIVTSFFYSWKRRRQFTEEQESRIIIVIVIRMRVHVAQIRRRGNVCVRMQNLKM